MRREKLIKAIITVLVVAVSLLVINQSLNTSVKDLLHEEEYLLENRISSVKTSLEGSITPVEMVNRQTSITLEWLENGNMVLQPSPELELNAELGVYELADATGKWGFFSREPENFNRESSVTEISAALALVDLYNSVIRTRPDTAWLYYISANGFVFSVPAFPPQVVVGSRRMHTQEYWIDVIPENNPDGGLIVTHPYNDLGGKGMMVTFSMPVFAEGKFAGVTCMDVSINQLQKALSLGRGLGISGIVDEHRHPVANLENIPLENTYGFVADRTSRYGAFHRSGRDYVYENSILEGELLFVHRIPLARINILALNKSLPLILSIVALNILILLVVRLRYSYLNVSRERDFSRRLLSLVGHDLQSPLSVTRQATEVLVADKNWDAVELIQRSTLSALSLLKDLSFWGKSRFGEIHIQKVPCNVSYLVGRVMAVVRPNAELKGVSLSFETEVPVVLADPDVLSAVLRNLMTNAIKFSLPGQAVVLSVLNGPESYVLITVSDEGDGMDESQVKDILNRKPLASRPGTRGEKGSGIGLSLVTSLCDQAGWPITLVSAHDKGTKISVSVPLGE